MNILFLSQETPIFPAGGIGVYVGQAATALKMIGHNIFLLTWRSKAKYAEPESYAPFDPDNVHIEWLDQPAILREHAPLIYAGALSEHLADLIVGLAEHWKIDVIEGCDFQAPALAAFRIMRAEGLAPRRLLVTYNHGLHAVIAAANGRQITLADQALHTMEAKGMEESDLVIAPSQATKAICRSRGIKAHIKVMRETGWQTPFATLRTVIRRAPAASHP